MGKAQPVVVALLAAAAVSSARFSFEVGGGIQAGFGEVMPEPEDRVPAMLAWGELGAGAAIGPFRPMAGVALRSPTIDRRVQFPGDTAARISVHELGVPLSLTWQPARPGRMFVRADLCPLLAIPGNESEWAEGFRSRTSFSNPVGVSAGAAAGWLFRPCYVGLAVGWSQWSSEAEVRLQERQLPYWWQTIAETTTVFSHSEFRAGLMLGLRFGG